MQGKGGGRAEGREGGQGQGQDKGGGRVSESTLYEPAVFIKEGGAEGRGTRNSGRGRKG